VRAAGDVLALEVADRDSFAAFLDAAEKRNGRAAVARAGGASRA
jgi:hypothetical protein